MFFGNNRKPETNARWRAPFSHVPFLAVTSLRCLRRPRSERSVLIMKPVTCLYNCRTIAKDPFVWTAETLRLLLGRALSSVAQPWTAQQQAARETKEWEVNAWKLPQQLDMAAALWVSLCLCLCLPWIEEKREKSPGGTVSLPKPNLDKALGFAHGHWL